jgi:hypothetical protein
MQLDIFEHSRDVMLRNDVLHALQGHDQVAARAAWHALSTEYPQDPSLQPLARLLTALEQSVDTCFNHLPAAQAALQALRDTVEPSALQLFGERDGSAWLAPLWRQMAQRAARLEFRAEYSEAHAAALFLRSGDFSAAAEAVERIASWRRIPAPLAWMSEARFRLDGLDACWDLLAQLAWLSPSRFDTLTKRLADPVLQRLRRQFDAQFEGEGDVTDLVWFPAWLLIERPALAAALGQAEPAQQDAPERGMRMLLDLLHLERQGRQRDLVAQRRCLRDLQPVLYAAYMKSR